MRFSSNVVAVFAIIGLIPAASRATELKPETVAAFDHYIHATEMHMADNLDERHFFVMDRSPEGRRQEIYTQLRQGQLYLEHRQTRGNDGRPIQIPGGLIHHWVGVIFIPSATVSQTLAILQDYDTHKVVYGPDIRRSQLLEHTGNEFKVYRQLYHKSIVTVMINANFDIHYTMAGPTRVLSQSYSTRIAEVANPGQPNEHELPVGNDHGYIWRLYHYWRIEEKDGGVYLQIESIGLSRSVPWGLGWLVNPLVQTIPREVLSRLLLATRKAVLTHLPPK